MSTTAVQWLRECPATVLGFKPAPENSHLVLQTGITNLNHVVVVVVGEDIISSREELISAV